MCLNRLSVGVEFANQSRSVLFGSRREMGDEGLDQFPTGAAEGFRATEVCCVSLYEIWIEVVLADEKAELISEPGLAVAGTVGGMGSV